VIHAAAQLHRHTRNGVGEVVVRARGMVNRIAPASRRAALEAA
jgi:hypothetical protein